MSEKAKEKKATPRVVTIGGGTGQFTVLSGLKKQPVDLTAIVTMADNGGSTGVLRDELGALPPGDLRQCLVALSEADDVMRELFTYRFSNGGLKGHTFGNIFISTLETVTGSLDEALNHLGDILNIKGKVIPVTLDHVDLVMELKNGKILKGEHDISSYQLVSKFGIKKMSLVPRAKLNKKATSAIHNADVIIVGPGNFYSSVVPNFLVDGMGKAFLQSKAKKIFIANLMNKHGQTDDFTIGTYIKELEGIIGKPAFDAVLYNTTLPPKKLLSRYVDEGEPLEVGPREDKTRLEYRGADLLATTIAKRHKGDALQRTLIRHDSFKLAQAIMEYIVEVT